MVSTLLVKLVFWWLFASGASGGQRGPAQTTTRSPHGALAIPCENCHTFTAWKPIRNLPEFDHNKTRYPLRGLHKGVSCRQCHGNLVFTNTGAKCADCHADIHRRQFGAQCEQCHTVRGWQVSLQAVQQHQNRFPLVGAHAAVECDACHKGAATGQFQGLPTDCVACHFASYEKAKVPDHRLLNFPTRCQDCHRMDSWLGAQFDHARFTGFALTGAHAGLDCLACHVGGRFQGTPATCYGCHAQAFNGTRNPNHVQAGFSQQCQQCHSTSSWSGAKFDHAALTGFALTGAHAGLDCVSCHVGGRYQGTPANCYGCHAQDYNGAKNPNHVQAGFPQQCQQCHSTTTWQGAKFDHNSFGFALTGAHANVACQQCHVNGRFAGTPANCYGCHAQDFNGAKNPDHVQAGFPQTCQQCHTTTSWQGATFDHSSVGFPLTGAHANVTCVQCHVGGRYQGTPASCYGCHAPDYTGAKNPDHVQAGFPQQCQQCHTTTSWQGAKFDHNTLTKFPLTGAHVNVTCAQCHVNGQFAGTPTNCYGCHAPDFSGAKNPDHVKSGFPLTCQQCHNTASWAGAIFDHSTVGFPLTGAHASVLCVQCHANGRFAGTPKDCASCHLADFQKTANPNHVAAGFPTDCSICHTTSSWAGAQFDHSKTLFPLTGAHTTLGCVSCHSSGKYAGLPTTCVSCHLNNFNSTTNPNHVAAGFPQDCQICHTTTAWTPSSFNHNNTGFPLTGAHTKVACASCHVGGRYAGTPTDCYSCHRADFQGTTNPNHVSAAFPTTCATCHTTTTWAGATFNHTWFPIYSGTHAGKWTTCADCHTNTSNYAVFSCVTCHAHEKTAMDQKHQGVRNYVYNSSNCYACHPSGQGG